MEQNSVRLDAAENDDHWRSAWAPLAVKLEVLSLIKSEHEPATAPDRLGHCFLTLLIDVIFPEPEQ